MISHSSATAIPTAIKTQFGIDFRHPPSQGEIIEMEDWECTKAFGEIREGWIISAGYSLSKCGYIISAKRFDDIVVGNNLFHEHFNRWYNPYEFADVYFRSNNNRVIERFMKNAKRESKRYRYD